MAESVAAVKSAGGKSVEGKKILDTVTKLTDGLRRATDTLASALEHEGALQQPAHGLARLEPEGQFTKLAHGWPPCIAASVGTVRVEGTRRDAVAGVMLGNSATAVPKIICV